jgi:hypothetical protein
MVMATATPHPTSATRDTIIQPAEPVCGTSMMMVAVDPARRATARITALITPPMAAPGELIPGRRAGCAEFRLHHRDRARVIHKQRFSWRII